MSTPFPNTIRSFAPLLLSVKWANKATPCLDVKQSDNQFYLFFFKKGRFFFFYNRDKGT